MSEKMIKIERVAVEIDVSVQTINTWYRFKKNFPDNEYAKILPEYHQDGCRRTRYWNISDLDKLREFKQKIPHGHTGVMGKLTHKNRHKKGVANAKKKSK